MIVASLPTIPPRRQTCLHVIRRILFEQTRSPDALHVWLNGYKEIPADFPNDERLKFHLQPDNPGPWVRYCVAESLSDDTILATLDDDVIYPNDYIERGVKELESMGERSAVCFSGMFWDPILENFSYSMNRWQCVADKALDHYQKVALHFGQTSFFWVADVRGCINFDLPGFRTNDDMMIGGRLQKKGVDIVCCPKQANWIKDTEFSVSPHALHRRDAQTRHSTLKEMVERLGFDPTAGLLPKIFAKPNRILVLADSFSYVNEDDVFERHLRDLCSTDTSVHVLAVAKYSENFKVQQYANIPFHQHIVLEPDPGGRFDNFPPVHAWRSWRINRTRFIKWSEMYNRCMKSLRPTRTFRYAAGRFEPL
jgi:hypothetical protein